MSTRGATTRVRVVMEPPLPTQKESDDAAVTNVHFEMVDELKDDALHHTPSVDPIRWFAGVLVPTTLRQAQASFRRAMHIAVDLASRRAKLETSSHRLAALIKLQEQLNSEVHLPQPLDSPEISSSND
ncbi:Coiled-coil domain-containing protein [Fasciola gigantica]|uniref:Vacuolar ATPase assembly protein VMA22 n=1 Tax=Fasciola gigantica TaxID=46835 RepID=A0A504YU56_FASGI|nr:Coiled-coil domain-containing protein [Fasciola gigantica]